MHQVPLDLVRQVPSKDQLTNASVRYQNLALLMCAAMQLCLLPLECGLIHQHRLHQLGYFYLEMHFGLHQFGSELEQVQQMWNVLILAIFPVLDQTSTLQSILQ